MASASEIFRVVGKVVLEGQDVVEKALDSVGKKAETVDSSFKKGFGGIDKNIPKNVTKPIDDSINTTANRMNKFESQDSKGFMDVIKNGFGIGLGMKAFDAASGIFEKFGGAVKNSIFGMNSTLQTSQLQFETLMGSADLAQKQVAFLFDFAKKTPFETGPIIEASKLMQTFGGNALNTEGNLTLIGDAAAATGAPIEELGMWTGRLYAALQAGKPFGDAASRLGELAVLTPQARLEMEKMQAEGKSADEIFAYFQKTLGSFSGAMEKQANTWEGLTGTFSDTINILSAKAMKPFFELASKGLGQLNTLLGSDAFANGAEKIATGIANAISGGLSSVGKLVTAVGPKLSEAFGIAKNGVLTFTQALSGNWEKATGIETFSVVLGTVGTVIHGTVIPAIKDFIDTIVQIITFVKEHEAAQKALLVVLGSIAAAIAVWKAYQAAMSAVSTVTKAFTAVQAAMNAAMDANPVGLVIIALAALAAGFVLLYQHSETFRNAVNGLWETIKPFAENIVTVFQSQVLPAVQGFVTSIIPSLEQFAAWFASDIIPRIVTFGTQLVTVFQTQVLPAITSFVSAVLPTLQQFAGWFASEIIPRITTFGTQLAGVFTGQILPAIVGFVQTIMPMLQEFGDWFVATALPQIQQFVTELLQAWDEIEPKIIAAIQSIVQAITVSLGLIITLVQTHGGLIQQYLGLAWETVSSTIGGALEIIENVIKLALDLISGNWSGAWNDVVGIFKGVWDTITGILTPAITLIQAAISAFTTAVGSTFSALGTLTNTIWTAISTAISGAMNAVQVAITPILAAIQTIWETTWTAIQVIADTVWRAIETIVRVEMALLQTIIEPILNAISALWSTVWTGIQVFAQTTWDFINNNIVQPVFGAIQAYISTTLSAIQTLWNTVWSAVQTTAETVWNAIKSFITGIWNDLSSAATSTWNAIQSAVETPINAAKDTLAGVWSEIQQKATDTWDAIKQHISDAGNDIKNALMWPFEQMRDAVEGVMKAAGNNLLSPLQGAIDGFGDFVGGVRDAVNSISNKLGLGDIIRDTWSGARIRQLAMGTESWRGGPAILGEHGIEAARYPDGTVRMFKAAQMVDLPAGTKVYNQYETRRLVAQDPNINVHDGLSDTVTYGGKIYEAAGRGGAWGAIKGVGDKIKGLAGTALDYARSLAGKGAGAVVNELIDHLPVPKFPGELASIPGKAISAIKDKVVESITELVKLVKDNAPAEEATSTDPSTWGAPGTINGVSGTHIMEVAQQTAGGVLGYCERWVGDVMARAGVRYARAGTAFQHSQMQGTTPGTGPLGAPIFTGFGDPGDVSISMGNGMGFGTEGGRGTSIGAGPFKPYAGARFTLNPAENGMIVDRPTAIMAGETIRAQNEIVTPENLMADIVRRELAFANGTNRPISVTIQVTADTPANGYAAGKAAGKGFIDSMREQGFNVVTG